ncbi:MAG TPA: hypothetical protein EYP19_16410, partial [Desulfobacterales bacterium]|nr:hypothetical protein [Desulfobacterales bacterium]
MEDIYVARVDLRLNVKQFNAQVDKAVAGLKRRLKKIKVDLGAKGVAEFTKLNKAIRSAARPTKVLSSSVKDLDKHLRRSARSADMLTKRLERIGKYAAPLNTLSAATEKASAALGELSAAMRKVSSRVGKAEKAIRKVGKAADKYTKITKRATKASDDFSRPMDTWWKRFGAVVKTDGWLGYNGLALLGYNHQVIRKTS